jgi:hypothetical protein
LTGIGVESAPGDVSIELIRNNIRGFAFGIAAYTSVAWGLGKIDMLLMDNTISANIQDGIHLGGNGITAELVRNEIGLNGAYGIRLALPGCMENLPRELRFQGVVKGAERAASP